MWVWARCFRCVVLPVIRFSSWVTFLVVGAIYGWWWWDDGIIWGLVDLLVLVFQLIVLSG